MLHHCATGDVGLEGRPIWSTSQFCDRMEEIMNQGFSGQT